MSVINREIYVFDIECYCLAEYNKLGKIKSKDQYIKGDWQYDCHGLTRDEMFLQQACFTTDEWMVQRKYLSRWNEE